MPGVALSRRVSKAVAYPPLCAMSAGQRREFQEGLLEANAFDDLPGKWFAGAWLCAGVALTTLGSLAEPRP